MRKSKPPSSGDYEVGYGRPPKATQFQKGRSGNPRGRPKKEKAPLTDLFERLHHHLHSTITVKEDGVTREREMLDVIAQKLLHSIASGKIADPNKVLNFLERLEDRQQRFKEDVRSDDGAFVRAKIEAMAKRISEQRERDGLPPLH